MLIIFSISSRISGGHFIRIVERYILIALLVIHWGHLISLLCASFAAAVILIQLLAGMEFLSWSLSLFVPMLPRLQQCPFAHPTMHRIGRLASFRVPVAQRGTIGVAYFLAFLFEITHPGHRCSIAYPFSIP